MLVYHPLDAPPPPPQSTSKLPIHVIIIKIYFQHNIILIFLYYITSKISAI